MIDVAILIGLGLLSITAVVLLAMTRRPPTRSKGRRRERPKVYAR